jgi:hypothetical protein
MRDALIWVRAQGRLCPSKNTGTRTGHRSILGRKPGCVVGALRAPKAPRFHGGAGACTARLQAALFQNSTLRHRLCHALPGQNQSQSQKERAGVSAPHDRFHNQRQGRRQECLCHAIRIPTLAQKAREKWSTRFIYTAVSYSMALAARCRFGVTCRRSRSRRTSECCL